MTMFHVVETIARFTPLGIRFWDPETGTPVRDGLRVTARREGREEAEVTALRTRSGIYAFQGIPGLRSVEDGEAPMFGSDVLPIQQRYIVEVEDTEGRYVPTALVVDLPREERGIFPPAISSSFPDEPVPGFFLYSAVTRPIVASLAAVYADLVDGQTLEPAAHAVLEVVVDGSTYYGIADAEGRAVVVFPYPPIQITLEGSFPEGRTPLHTYDWDVTVRVCFAPGQPEVPPFGEIPILSSLFEQEGALLYADAPTSLDPGVPEETLTASLTFGQPVVLRSLPEAVLYIEPISSIQ